MKRFRFLRILPESVLVGLEYSGQPLLYNVWPEVEVLKLWVALGLTELEGGLCHQVGLLPFLGLSHAVLLLELLDQRKRLLQVTRGGVDLTWKQKKLIDTGKDRFSRHRFGGNDLFSEQIVRKMTILEEN